MSVKSAIGRVTFNQILLLKLDCCNKNLIVSRLFFKRLDLVLHICSSDGKVVMKYFLINCMNVAYVLIVLLPILCVQPFLSPLLLFRANSIP